MSLYRLSTANTYDRARFNIQQRQSELATSQSQLSSGKRVQRASDDSVAATLSERTLNRLARTEADLRSLEASRRSLSQAESSLSTATDLYGRVKELIVQGGDAGLNAADRSSIAHELRGIREQLLSLSNERDSAGKPLFAGLGPQNSQGEPFVEALGTPYTASYGPDGRAVNWDGTQGQEAATEYGLPGAVNGYPIFAGGAASTVGAVATVTSGNMTPKEVKITGTPDPAVFDLSANALASNQGSVTLTYNSGTGQFDVSRFDSSGAPIAGAIPSVTPSVADGETTLDLTASLGFTVRLKGTPAAGTALTVKPAISRDVWETLDRAIGALEGGATAGAALTQELSQANGQMAYWEDQLQLARGKLGDWLNRADNLEANFSERSVAYEKENSELVDVDMLKAVSDFQMNQTAYQAALQSYSQVQKMSMFDYLR